MCRLAKDCGARCHALCPVRLAVIRPCCPLKLQVPPGKVFEVEAKAKHVIVERADGGAMGFAGRSSPCCPGGTPGVDRYAVLLAVEEKIVMLALKCAVCGLLML